RPGSEWRPFLRNRALTDRGFVNCPDFMSFLTDPGTGYTHPRKRELRLHDLYVYPELVQRPVQQNIEKTKPSAIAIKSKDVLNFAQSHEYLLFVGDDNSGKTASKDDASA